MNTSVHLSMEKIMQEFIKSEIINKDQIPNPKKMCNRFYRDLLRDINGDKALVLEYDNEDSLNKGQARIHYASISEFGTGKIRTQRNGLKLYVWRKSKYRKINK